MQFSPPLPSAAVSRSVYSIDGERIVAGELARGPWDERAQHGGAPAALIVRALELAGAEIDRRAAERERDRSVAPTAGGQPAPPAAAPQPAPPTAAPQPAPPAAAPQPAPGAPLALARITYELLRPVPLGELALSVELLRPGRRVQLLEASLRDAAGVEVVRARALRLRRSDAGARAEEHATATGAPLPPPPDHAQPAGAPLAGARPMFAEDAVEVRFVQGSWAAAGPATAWFRLRVPLVAGETPSPLQRLAAAADFPNGIASALDWQRFTFINPDLTIYIEREPLGEWICLRAQTRIQPRGVGFAEAELFDCHGRVGRCCQSLLIAAR